jgi:hypothetical protein
MNTNITVHPGEKTYNVGEQLLIDMKRIEHGGSTLDGIHMLSLGNDNRNNYAGNMYLDALHTIKKLLKLLNEKEGNNGKQECQKG